MLSAATLFDYSTENDDYNGLANLHSYKVVGLVTLDTGVRLVKMRDHSGDERYTGPYCGECSEWTEETAAQVDLEQST